MKVRGNLARRSPPSTTLSMFHEVSSTHFRRLLPICLESYRLSLKDWRWFSKKNFYFYFIGSKLMISLFRTKTLHFNTFVKWSYKSIPWGNKIGYRWVVSENEMAHVFVHSIYYSPSYSISCNHLVPLSTIPNLFTNSLDGSQPVKKFRFISKFVH